MNETKAIARRAGAIYFVFMIISIVGEFLFPTFVVPGDAATTAGNIAAGELTYRIGILLGFVTHLIFIFLVVVLYQLFKDVDKSHALLMVLFVSIGITIALARLVLKFAPLVILDGADYLSVFSESQRDAVSLGILRFYANSAVVPMAFWGLWLFPFGILAIKSDFIPRIFGYLLIVAGVGYLVTSVASILLPDYRSVLFNFMMPLYFCEVPIIFYLLIKGAKVPQAAP